MKLVIAEKPSAAQSLAKVIGATKRQDGYRRRIIGISISYLYTHETYSDALVMKSSTHSRSS